MPYLNILQKQLHYADSHPQGAPEGGLSFICIHGLGSSQNYYFPIVHHLTTKHRCITFDTYGSGRSKYTGLVQSVETIAQDVLAIMDELTIRKAVIIGHSMGGMIATYIASRFPDRTSGVVAIGPVHPTPKVAPVFQQRVKIVSENGMEPMANTIPEAATGSKSSPLHRAFIRELLLGQDPSGYISLCNVIATAQPPNYEAVKVPYLLIAGQDDKSAPLNGCKYIYEGVASQNKVLEILPGVGHWHCIEAADEVGKLISDFSQAIEST